MEKKINLPISHKEKRVREIDCGKMEGTTLEERISKWGNNWREQDLEMEKFEDVGKRGKQFLEEIILRYLGKRILIVSHGAFIGLTLKQILPAVFQDTYIDNTSLTILNHSDGNWECTLYNCTKHIM
ncbi:histidine phosphatase family protein [Niallia sp. RD1]|uniref:histidine phosphatase family protein n=1 Tax=Niallia sp. RD1 TaxID=2962858 RepID=UPI000332A15B|nr:histidine phosphatase family protein [Niallia sp. RD1]EOR20922.1 phosphoglycerate mutase [Niallia nealsonii AAU1]UTI40724.1 histidine phosphatase family protein [Niallia sp. RD1]